MMITMVLGRGREEGQKTHPRHPSIAHVQDQRGRKEDKKQAHKPSAPHLPCGRPPSSSRHSTPCRPPTCPQASASSSLYHCHACCYYCYFLFFSWCCCHCSCCCHPNAPSCPCRVSCLLGPPLLPPEQAAAAAAAVACLRALLGRGRCQRKERGRLPAPWLCVCVCVRRGGVGVLE
jgi:hypothetical protein